MRAGTSSSNSKNEDLLSGDYHIKEQSYVSMESAVVPPVLDHDDDDDDHSIAESIVSSVLTADGIHDYTGFLCVCLVILIGDMSRGVMFPSMWPLVEALGGNQVTLGFSVAAFSFGRVLVNPVFGAWSHSIGYSKTLLISSYILLFGALSYAQIQNIGKPEFLIVSQTLLGVGSGTLGVTRAYVAEITAKRSRTTYMAWITAVQYGGFTVTPFFGALFNWALQNTDVSFGPIRINMFTAPAYFMALIIVITITVLSLYFQDRQRFFTKKDAKKSAKQLEVEDVANQKTFIGLSVYDCCILGCMLLNVSTKGSIASFETLGIAIAQSYFDLMASKAAAIIATCGLFGVFSLLSMGYLSARFTDIQLITGGMIVMAAGITSLINVEHHELHNPSWLYSFSMFLIYSIGYPIGHTAVIGLFSKSKYVLSTLLV